MANCRVSYSPAHRLVSQHKSIDTIMSKNKNSADFLLTNFTDFLVFSKRYILNFTFECDTNQRFFKISSLASFISLVKAELIIRCVYRFRHLHGCLSICFSKYRQQPMKTGISIGVKFKFFLPLTSMIMVVRTTENNLLFHQCCSRLFQQYC